MVTNESVNILQMQVTDFPMMILALLEAMLVVQLQLPLI
jgi:hypothetical protein